MLHEREEVAIGEKTPLANMCLSRLDSQDGLQTQPKKGASINNRHAMSQYPKLGTDQKKALKFPSSNHEYT